MSAKCCIKFLILEENLNGLSLIRIIKVFTGYYPE